MTMFPSFYGAENIAKSKKRPDDNFVYGFIFCEWDRYVGELRPYISFMYFKSVFKKRI